MSEWTAETAEWYAEKYGEYATNRLAVDALDLARDSIVIDVGCGAGSALRHAALRVTESTLIGIDPVPRMVEIARERALSHPHDARLEFRQGSAEDLPVDDHVADFVFAFDSFDHWLDPPRGLAEVRRILKSDGQLVVVKDGGVPDGGEARSALIDALGRAEFEIRSEQQIAGDDVSFVMWICSPTS